MNILLLICAVLVAFSGQIMVDSEPFNVTEKDRKITIDWVAPEKGVKDLYIGIKALGPTYYVPPGCTKTKSTYISLYSYGKTSYAVDGPLEVATEYEISIKFKVKDAWGKPAVRRFTSADGKPEKVADLKCKLETDAKKITTLSVDWQTPCKANSANLAYVIEVCPLVKDKVVPKSCSTNSTVPKHAARSAWTAKNLKADTKYELRLSASIAKQKSAAAICKVPQPPPAKPKPAPAKPKPSKGKGK